MTGLNGSGLQLWPGDLSSEAVARGYLEVWAMTRGLEQWGCSQNMTGGLDQLWSFDWVTALQQVWPGDLTVWPIVNGMTGGPEHLGGDQYHDSNPARWPRDLKIKDLTGGLNSYFEFGKMTGGPDKWLVNILMTGGLGQTSCDRGTLIFLMDSLNS